ncbi:MAG: TetR/AcrR family transcriptional regulator C-terminal domain-containing protein [Neisseriaceae bacterium]|nr:TetR/AcrR family transcriptional regulator C-terminal domain-containing protein [Neisseriaceae bacterium]MBP6861207.1 TetR/AcrR family transcriptional regulator C-terminal domain-containing protein [Neisseriaceae bacterium]
MSPAQEHIIATALDLLDELGLEGLTMRKLAQALKIQVPSLYWHFKNKEALLEAVADTLLASVAQQPITLDEEWSTQLMAVATDIRQALLRRRDGARFLATTYPISENGARVTTYMIQLLKNAGADEQTATWSVIAMISYVIGFTIEEQSLSNKNLSKKQHGDALQAIFHKYPMGNAIIQQIQANNMDEWFDFGLRLPIDTLSLRLSKTQA